MARYKVLRPVEHNQKLYIPSTALSAANGAEIQVDASGFIQLSDPEASQLAQGQIEPVREETTAETDEATTSPATGSSRKTKS